MRTPTAYFRFHASLSRGAGHAMRCLTLAQTLQKHNWNCIFVTEAESYEFVEAITQFKRMEPEHFYAEVEEHDLLVVDHYDCDKNYELRFRNQSKIIMALDDLADREHACDIILDQAYGRTPSDYRNKTSANCLILTGPEYALLRDEFCDLRHISLERRKLITSIKRILINFGGNDQKNIILAALKKLKEISYVGAIDVVYGLSAPHRESVETFAASMPNQISFYTNPRMAALLAEADFAVGAPAGSALERFCLGLPTLIIQSADNQAFTYSALCRDGLALGGTLDALEQRGFLIDFDAGLYRQRVDECAALVDGQGANRIAQIIQNNLISKQKGRA